MTVDAAAVLTAVREAQLPVICVMLYVAALAKLATLPPRGGAGAAAGYDRATPGPALLVGARRRRPAVIAVAAVEAAIATGLLVAPGVGTDAFRLAGAIVFATGAFVLLELRSRHPGAGCGCFGAFSRTPVGVRALGRSVVLAIASAVLAGLPGPGVALIRGFSPLSAVVAAVELALLVALAPETGALVSRLTHREPCETARVPVAQTLRALRASDAWREHRALLTGRAPADVWRELCWRYVVYPGTCDGRPVRIVFAVRLGDRHPEVRAAVVDGTTGEVRRRAPAPAPTEPSAPPASTSA